MSPRAALYMSSVQTLEVGRRLGWLLRRSWQTVSSQPFVISIGWGSSKSAQAVQLILTGKHIFRYAWHQMTTLRCVCVCACKWMCKSGFASSNLTLFCMSAFLHVHNSGRRPASQSPSLLSFSCPPILSFTYLLATRFPGIN